MFQLIFSNYIVAGVTLLGVLVFVHEFGHFIIAKLMGVKVLTFSIGFGPRIFGFKYGDTDYRISIIPLGGYVRMYGDESMEGEVPDDEKEVAYLYKSVPAKIAIAAAGPLANFIFPVVLLFFIFLGATPFAKPFVGEVLDQSAAAKAGLKTGDQILSINEQEVHSFQEMNAVVRPNFGKELTLRLLRQGEEKNLKIVPDTIVAGDVVRDFEKRGRLGISSGTVKAKIVVDKDSIAEKSGLKNGDEVVLIYDIGIRNAGDLLDAMNMDLQGASFKVLRSVFAKEPLVDVKKEKIAAEDVKEERVEKEFTVQILREELPTNLNKEAFDAVLEKKMKQARSFHLEKHAVSREELKKEKVAKYILHAEKVLQAEDDAGRKHLGIHLLRGQVRLVKKGTVADSLGIEEGDQVLAIDGISIVIGTELGSELEARPDDVHVMALRKKDGMRNDVLIFRMEPRREHGQEDFKEFGIGISSPTHAGPLGSRDVGAVEAFKLAVAETGNTMVLMVKSLGKMFTGQLSMKSVGGPILIFDLAQRSAAQGASSFLHLMVLISVSLGVFNLLPMPVLDGGHIVLFLVEAVRGKKATLQTQERLLKVGLFFLLSFMIFAIGNDLIRKFFSDL